MSLSVVSDVKGGAGQRQLVWPVGGSSVIVVKQGVPQKTGRTPHRGVLPFDVAA